MSKYSKSFCGEYGTVKCSTLKKWTDELKDANDKERVLKAKAEIQKHKAIAKDVDKLLREGR